MRIIIFLLSSLFLCSSVNSQVGIGMVFGNDLFQSVQNELDGVPNAPKSVLLSPYFGPKLYIGGERLSVSLHTGIGISAFSWDWSDYKGMGTLYAPALFSINFGGLSGFTEEKSALGFSVVGGYLITMTDLYFRAEEYSESTVNLNGMPLIQLAAGTGGKGASLYGYFRYGYEDSNHQFYSLGIGLEVNFTQRKKYR
nr:hypothetical protein [Saprospiraceae bacterium]